MNLFYSHEINAETVLHLLPEEEGMHAIRVLRMKKGDKIFLTDGRGMFYTGEIESDNPKKCSVKIIRAIEDKAKRNFRLAIAIAPTKNIDRFEWFLEKAAEIGCDEIIPIHCRHSERDVIKTERLNKVLIAAMKQCLKSELPKLHELTAFKNFVKDGNFGKVQKLIGHIPELDESEFPPQNLQGKSLQSACKKGENVLIAIGAEGGFSEEEVSLAEKNGFILISLGNSRLRVETAGVAACSIINALNQ